MEATDQKSATLANLLAAFNGETNAHHRYLAFAAKADQEGYGKVASLFRAAARAEEIHARNHAAVIKALGGTAKADVKTPEVKTTRENLAVAIQGETYEFQKMYPEFIAQAKTANNRQAIRTFSGAMEAEIGHAKAYQDALDHLDQWKGGKKEFYVCPVCGYTVDKLDFDKCPVCTAPREKFVTVT
jgi:rubrerythrin